MDRVERLIRLLTPPTSDPLGIAKSVGVADALFAMEVLPGGPAEEATSIEEALAVLRLYNDEGVRLPLSYLDAMKQLHRAYEMLRRVEFCGEFGECEVCGSARVEHEEDCELYDLLDDLMNGLETESRRRHDRH